MQLIFDGSDVRSPASIAILLDAAKQAGCRAEEGGASLTSLLQSGGTVSDILVRSGYTERGHRWYNPYLKTFDSHYNLSLTIKMPSGSDEKIELRDCATSVASY